VPLRHNDVLSVVHEIRKLAKETEKEVYLASYMMSFGKHRGYIL